MQKQVVVRYMADGELQWCRIIEEDKAIILQELIICEFGEHGDFYIEIEDLENVEDQGDWQEFGTTGATLCYTGESYVWFCRLGTKIKEDIKTFSLYQCTDEYEVVDGFFITYTIDESYVGNITPAQLGYSVEMDEDGNEIGGPLTWEDIAP